MYTSLQWYDDYDAVGYNMERREIAEVLLAVDPDVLLLGPGTSEYALPPQSITLYVVPH